MRVVVEGALQTRPCVHVSGNGGTVVRPGFTHRPSEMNLVQGLLSTASSSWAPHAPIGAAFSSESGVAVHTPDFPPDCSTMLSLGGQPAICCNSPKGLKV